MSSRRTKNLGFKEEGIDPAQDAVYSILESLPRGARTDLIVKAVIEFVKKHSGEAVQIRGKSIIVLGGELKPSGQSSDHKRSPPVQRASRLPPSAPAAAPSGAIAERKTEYVKELLDDEGLHHPVDSAPAPSSFTELDDDTLDGIVLGFSFSDD